MKFYEGEIDNPTETPDILGGVEKVEKFIEQGPAFFNFRYLLINGFIFV